MFCSCSIAIFIVQFSYVLNLIGSAILFGIFNKYIWVCRCTTFKQLVLHVTSFLNLHASTFAPTDNSFAHFSDAQRKIRDSHTGLPIAISNSLARPVLNAKRWVSCESTVNLGLTPKSTSSSDFTYI